MVMTCFVSGCGAISFRDCGISFYSFPTDLKLCEKWENAIVAGTSQTNMARRSKHSKVCSNHFSIPCFRTDVSTARYPKLNGKAIPSIFVKKINNNKRRLPSRSNSNKKRSGNIINNKLNIPNEILKIIDGVEDDEDKNEHDEYGWTCSSSSNNLLPPTYSSFDQEYMIRMPKMMGNLKKMDHMITRQGKHIVNLEDKAYKLEQRLKKIEITFKFDN